MIFMKISYNISPGLIFAWNVTCGEPSVVDKGPAKKFKF